MNTSQPLRMDMAKLKAKRIERRMTRAALARKTGITVDHLYCLETGRRTGTREVTLAIIADALECTEADLLADQVAA